MAPAAAGPHVWREAVATLYNVTPAEMRVLAGVLEGTAAADVAKGLELSEATVRSHLKSIFAKTGTSRQSELVSRVSALSLPL